MKLLFDADILVFRCGLAAERQVWNLAWDKQGDVFKQSEEFQYKKDLNKRLDEVLPGVYSRQEGEDYMIWAERKLEPLSHALANVNSVVKRTLNSLQHNDWDIEMYLSPTDGSNFRHDIAKAKPYKGNRDRLHRPTYEQEIRDHITSKWHTVVAEKQEADDLLGIMQTKIGPEDSVIVSIDKDLDQIPGYKYNFVHDVLYMITPEEAIRNFHMQLLMGDSTDNIPGLPGIGKARAKQVLDGLETEAEQMDAVCRMYASKGPEDWEEYLREQGRLLYIRRQPDELWDFTWCDVPVEEVPTTLEVE